ncbi:MAG TPA: AAA family ATPase [Gaiellaceae bacterium]|nr:AAA family ATPase [Gaiellaceae bacterium]
MTACPSCGNENASGAKFCPECGRRLAGAPPTVEERKVVSVVFCDLVGSTARAERLDPEDVRAELSSFHARVRAELERRGGTVEKFIGDAVVAVFGAPVVHEDDPERAVRAALAIRDWAVDEGGAEVRLAVNTGEALVTVGARPETGEGLVAGDVINTAARLQSAAPVNGILVGEATRRATERAIEYREHPPVAAKGKHEPVPVSEAVAARSLFGVDVELRPHTRLVGRTRELDQLLDALARARAEREPQLVTIAGVPGMGKSRLVQELSAAIDRESELIRWRQGRSLPYGQGVSFWALGEMVKAEAGILESDAADVAEAKLRGVVARVCAAADVDWIGSTLRPLIGIAEDTSGSDRRGEAFAGWRRFVEGLAAERPSVLVFEDLHWADDGLLDFVDGLVDWATDVPLLVVATARPELLARRAHWGGGKPNATTLSLAPLSEAETAELVHAVLERSVLPADVQAAVLARAGGNPLYAEEFARLVAGRGSVGGDLPVPDSLQGLISARLDALTRDEKELLQDAAVLGKVFWRGALTDGRAPNELDDALRTLERKEFVRRDRRSSVEAEEQYAFRHVLVRDVAYAQIPRAARAERHQRAAAWIEARVRAEDAAELLAHHYVSALEYAQAVGLDVSELTRQARGALRDAARRAVTLNAYTNATRFYEDALALTPEDDPEWPRLALDHAEATTYVDVTTGDRFLERAREALAAGEPDDAARSEMVLAEFRWLRGDRVGADTHFRAAEALTAQMRDPEARLRVLANLGRFTMLSDEYERATALAQPALALAEQLGRDDMRAHALNTLGIARVSMGDDGGLDDLEESCALSRRVGGPEYLRATGNLASVLFNLGQLGRAAELHHEALEVARDIGYEEPTRWLSTEIAIDHELAGKWAEAREMVDELIPGYAASPFWIEPQTRICRARMLIAEGDVAQAGADVERALELTEAGRSFQSQCDPLAFRARLHAEIGELDAARRRTVEIVGLWAETRSAYLDQWVLDAWYTAWRTDEEARLDAAIAAMPPNPWAGAASAMIRRDFAVAAARLDEMGGVSAAALARLWAAEWLVEQGGRAEASEYLEPSLAFWRSVGASAYARRGESLLAAAS